MVRAFLKTHRIPLLLALLCGLFYWSFGYQLDRSDFMKLLSLYAGLFFICYRLIQIYGTNFWMLACFGIVFRLISIAALPNLSQDFYRFLWDGRLVLQGINPYLITPETYLQSGNEVVAQTRELYTGMGKLNGSHFSNYPPMNQLFFAIAALFAGKSIVGSVVVLKVIIVLADIGILFFGRKLLLNMSQDPHKIFWYFINPFIIVELSGNLHFEGVMLFFFVWALYLLQKKKWVPAAILIGLSISVKLIPLLLLPLFFQWFIKSKKSFFSGLGVLISFYVLTLLTVALTFLPFYTSEFATNFSSTIALWFQNFEFNASIYYIIRWFGFQTIGWNLIETVGKILPLIVIGFLLILTFFRKNVEIKQLSAALLLGISFYLLLSTTVHPWYIVTPLLLSVFTNYKFPIVWSFMVVLSYSAYSADRFSENLWLVGLEYVVVIGYFIWELTKRKFRTQPNV